MFDFIRSHQRLMQLLLLLLIVPSFVFFGVQGYERMAQRSQSVAKVDGQPITQGELDAAQRRQTERLRQSYGASLDASLFDTPEARAQTLDQLITQRVLMAQARKESLVTSDRKLQETLLAIPALQVDGRFDQTRYEALVAQQGMTPIAFEAQMREDIAMQQLDTAIEGSVIVPRKVVDAFATIVAQRREVRAMVFKPAAYASQVALAPDAVEKEYAARPDDFLAPERAKVEYVVLSPDALAKQVVVPPADEREFYERNKKRYEVPEQRRASHILVAVAKDASEADQAKAKAKAESLLQKLRATPPANAAAEFARLAKQSSDDQGSAVNGGDLDYLGRGATVPPFEDALFKLKDNEISDLVRSDFGFHVIELTGIRPAQVKPFDSVKGEIDAELGKQLAQRKFTDATEGFANGVYEQSDSLAPTATKFGLTVETAADVTRKPAPGADPANPLSDSKLLDALFSADSIKTKRNTEAVTTASGALVSARLVDYAPASRKPLAEVTDAIRARLVAAEARKKAADAGAGTLARLKAGDAAGAAGAPAFGAPATIGRGDRAALPAEAIAEVFRTDASKLPAYAGLALPSGDYAIYRIDGVTSAPAADAGARAALSQGIAKQLGTIEFGAYLADLRRRIKVQISPPYDDLIEKKAAAPARAGVS